jgi:hypothetical protein
MHLSSLNCLIVSHKCGVAYNVVRSMFRNESHWGQCNVLSVGWEIMDLDVFAYCVAFFKFFKKIKKYFLVIR